MASRVQVDVTSSSRCENLAKLYHFFRVSLFSVTAHAMLDRCFIALLRARVAMPCYKSVIQLGVGLYGIHNLGPTALGGVYPVETSTSLYKLYWEVPWYMAFVNFA